MMNDLDKFESKIKASLDANLRNLDSETREKLTVARRKALNQPTKMSWLNSWFKKEYWLPAGSFALCSLLAVFIVMQPKPAITPNKLGNETLSANQVAALELLDNAEDIDTVADPDFYFWVEEALAVEGKGNAA